MCLSLFNLLYNQLIITSDAFALTFWGHGYIFVKQPFSNLLVYNNLVIENWCNQGGESKFLQRGVNSWTQQNTPLKKSLSKIQKVSLCKFVHKLTLNFTSKKDYTSVKTPLVKKERRRFFLFFSIFPWFSLIFLGN